jgi:hypothetical protein
MMAWKPGGAPGHALEIITGPGGPEIKAGSRSSGGAENMQHFLLSVEVTTLTWLSCAYNTIEP